MRNIAAPQKPFVESLAHFPDPLEAGQVCQFEVENLHATQWQFNESFSCGNSAKRIVMCEKAFEVFKKVRRCGIYTISDSFEADFRPFAIENAFTIHYNSVLGCVFIEGYYTLFGVLRVPSVLTAILSRETRLLDFVHLKGRRSPI